MSNTIVMPISLPKDLAKMVDREAKTRSMTRSEFVRDLVRRQVSFSSLRELQRETARRAPKAGIKTVEDAVRAVRELRSGRLK